VTQPAPSVGGVGIALPTEVVALVVRALAYEKDQRWPDARAMQEALRHVYSKLTNKPITLLDAIEDNPSDDIAARESPAVSAPRTATTADGVTATNFGPASVGDTRTRRRVRIAVMAGAMALPVALAIASGLRTGSTPGAAPEPSSPRLPAGAASVVENAVPHDEVNADPVSPPVVPIERLPVASVAPARVSAGEQPRNPAEIVHPSATSSAVSPIPAHPIAISPKPAAPPGDPWAARH